LRKLEQEKASRDQPSAPSVREITLEPELALGPERERAGTSVKTIGIALFGLLLVSGIAAGAVTVTTMYWRRDPPLEVASAPKSPTKTTSVQTIVTPVAPIDDELPAEADQESEAEPSKSLQVARAAAPSVEMPKPETKKPEPVERPIPVEEEQQPAVPLPELPIAPDVPVVAKTTTMAEKGNVDFDRLPILTETDRVRLGLPQLKINIVGIPNSRNPRASALINMQKVYVGENIPSTQARLIDVDLRGVAIDVGGNRYFVSRR
ncbi:MAG TPA: hypothetical protein PK869_08710, partial [Candidatus Hydrogenedentes bacterium]|nr:hypothetical protein [Candidatus Hydrogenedentota bacterium]